MSIRAGRIFLTVATVVGIGGAPRADEQMVPLEESGDWIAMAHKPSMIAPADVCVVFNPMSGVAFRASADGLQFRITNERWALPTGVKGDIVISVGELKTTLNIDDNTDKMVNAEISKDGILPLFTAMDKASNMSVVAGEAKPFTVSLSGSTLATNAFRTCAGINSSSGNAATNPFK